jgi:hypothetical protein
MALDGTLPVAIAPVLGIAFLVLLTLYAAASPS